MGKHVGSCHCGSVRFEIDAPTDKLIDCNCSICRKKGIVHLPVEEGGFAITSGQDSLAMYAFGTGDASHWFCRHCGIHPFGRPRNNPDRYTVNARCLDDFEAILGAATIVQFDGQNHPKDAEE